MTTTSPTMRLDLEEAPLETTIPTTMINKPFVPHQIDFSVMAVVSMKSIEMITNISLKNLTKLFKEGSEDFSRWGLFHIKTDFYLPQQQYITIDYIGHQLCGKCAWIL